jgi:5,5'-dehydrodivanillate O-demethylase
MQETIVTPAQPQDDLLELAKTGPDSAMGKLLRSFWQPVAISAEVPAGRTMPVRILGEDLTLYRGESGVPHLVAARCAHRLNLLHTGWVQDDHLRCMYHGWMYDGTGQCVEMPAEDPSYPPRIRIAGYPVRDYYGLVFAYLGEGEPPEFDLPRHDELEAPGGVRWIVKQTWGCNWLQSVENSLDAVHVSFVHRWGILGPFGAAVTDTVPKLEYVETDSGIRQIARRSETNVRISDWTFPNHNHIVVPGLHEEDPWTHTIPWMVGVDDEHVCRFNWQVSRVEGAAADRLKSYLLTHGFEPTGEPDQLFARSSYDPVQHHDELFLERICPEPATNELTNAQDYVAQVGQGANVDRRLEHLGQSDAGVMMLRRLLLREAAALRDGWPTKEWRRVERAVDLPPQTGDSSVPGVGWDRKRVTAAV